MPTNNAIFSRPNQKGRLRQQFVKIVVVRCLASRGAESIGAGIRRQIIEIRVALEIGKRVKHGKERSGPSLLLTFKDPVPVVLTSMLI